MIIDTELFQKMRQTYWGISIDKSDWSPAEAAQHVVRSIVEATYHFNDAYCQVLMEPRDMVYEVDDLTERNKVRVEISWRPSVLDIELYDKLGMPPISAGCSGTVPHVRNLRWPIFAMTPTGKKEYNLKSWDTTNRRWIFSGK